MEVTLTSLPNNQTSISIVATGGVLDMFYLTGPTYDKVIQQYHTIIGKPKLIPQWAQGLNTKSRLFVDTKMVEQVI